MLLSISSYYKYSCINLYTYVSFFFKRKFYYSCHFVEKYCFQLDTTLYRYIGKSCIVCQFFCQIFFFSGINLINEWKTIYKQTFFLVSYAVPGLYKLHKAKLTIIRRGAGATLLFYVSHYDLWADSKVKPLKCVWMEKF